MFLVKCKCGSIFTLNDRWNPSSTMHCPNCDAGGINNEILNLKRGSGISASIESVSYIPDSAKITVNFDA